MKIQNILYVISKYLDLFEQAGNLFENLIIADFVKRNQNATPASERPNVGSGPTFVARIRHLYLKRGIPGQNPTSARMVQMT
ncbi:MAG: hypothetical protein IPK21_17745 [Haliscomenobacter sp.]|nr:hypothetical protein [Haliscomenobacter sp.]